MPPGADRLGSEGRLVAAMALLVAAGALQEAAFLAGHPGLGILAVAPALLVTAMLWRPGLGMAAIVLVYVGLVLLLPLQTGAGRYEDWILHYEIARHYAGLSNVATDYALAGRTPLFHQLTASVLAYVSQYWAFAIVAVVLNALWIWPATLLLQAWSGARRFTWEHGLLAIAVSPFILAYATYTWPWGFPTFFLLSAIYLSECDGRLSGAGVGLGLSGALLAHPGMLGYVAGAAVFILVRKRAHILPALGAGIVVAATAIPWVIDVTGGRGLPAMVAASVPARQAVSTALYLVTRVTVWATSIVPLAPIQNDRASVEWTIAMFVLTIPGALLAASFLMRRWMKPHGVAAWTVAFGVVIGWLIYPPNNSTVGMLDALYPAVVIVLVTATARAPERSIRTLLAVQASLAVVFFAFLLWVSASPVAGDGNLVLKTRYGARFLPDEAGYLPGAAVVLVGLALLALDLRRSGLSRSPGSASSSPPTVGMPP